MNCHNLVLRTSVNQNKQRKKLLSYWLCNIFIEFRLNIQFHLFSQHSTWIMEKRSLCGTDTEQDLDDIIRDSDFESFR